MLSIASKELEFLSWLQSKESQVDGCDVILLSQNELASEYGCSPTSINSWIKSLKDGECLKARSKKRGYIITPRGRAVLEGISKLKSVLNQEIELRPRQSCKSSFIDLFAGCGGLSLGLGLAGWDGVFAIEKDPMAFSSFKTNLIDDSPYSHFNLWPEWLPKEPADVVEMLENEEILAHLSELKGTIDLLAGGPPCQGFSVAGARNGDDPRNQLVFKQIKMIELIRPHFVIVENVGGFKKRFSNKPAASNAEMSVADLAANQIEELGYSICVIEVNAADFGVPQLRKRVLLFGIDRNYYDVDDVKSKLLDALRVAGQGQRIEFGLPIDRCTNSYEAISDLSGTDIVPDSEYPTFLTCRYTNPTSQYQKLMRANCMSQSVPTSHRFNKHSEKSRNLYRKAIETQGGGRLSKDFLYENGCHSNKRFVIDVNEPCSTVTTAPEELIHFKHPRVLTLREMARLQSFPDDFIFKGRYTLNGPCRGLDVPRNAQIGNAIPPLLGRALGLALQSIKEEAEASRLPSANC